jgi:hypothetical protein
MFSLVSYLSGVKEQNETIKFFELTGRKITGKKANNFLTQHYKSTLKVNS